MKDGGIRLERDALALFEEALEMQPDDPARFIADQRDTAAEIRTRAKALLDRYLQGDHQLATGGARTILHHEPPDHIGSYKVVDQLGRGGMGAVYLAERASGDFDHLVAIKLINAGAMSQELTERFRRERQIFAGLNHPHIARLYDGGETRNGEPYIVMEYVDGVPLEDWLESGDPSIDRRLDLFDQICGAVQFAHQNLIVHRDLTPANVLVKVGDDAKLIDFGISRPLGEPATAPLSDGVTSATPGFAAPEAIAGGASNTLSDIFALGRLLALLTEGETAPELDAIVAKASHDDPATRYRTAQELATEVDRYRTGFPVVASGGGRSYRFRKFIGRQKFAVGAVVAIILLLAGGLTATLIGFNRAQVAQAEAEQRFGEVRAMANTLLFDIYESVERVPGSTEARRMLASTAQRYLDALAADSDAPADVKLEAGRGYMRLADVMGGVGGGNLGLREEAARNYERADEILSELNREMPADRNVALALADLRYARSNFVVQTSDDMETGLTMANSIGPILEPACDDSDPCIRRRAQALIAQGQNHYWLEELDTALEEYGQAISLLQSMTQNSRRLRTNVRLLALARRFHGDTRYYLDDVAGSVEDFDIALALLRRARRSGLDDPDIRRDLALVQWTRGGSLDELGRVDEGVAALSEAEAIVRDLVAADREDEGTLRLLAVIGGQLGLTLSSANRFAEAIEAAEASLAIRTRLSRLQPDQQGYFRDVAIQLNGLGDIHRRAGNGPVACDYYRRTVSQFDRHDARWGMAEFDRGDTYARARQALLSC
ncbi:serine/threonine-protein kinase [uncultured Parasphingopyxis sp.]|uniref:serine/threonine-protein kinase n=1 Tax=uncultured Parasphingopyxis sp. TaxID=1547918 RepID=UPI002621342A|nr:serine/threonine-protein kinase [uncultured Parasphingopyxis sp.]